MSASGFPRHSNLERLCALNDHRVLDPLHGPVLKRDDAHCPTIFLVGCLEVGGNLETMLNQGGIVFDGGGAQVAQTERRARR